MNNKVPCLKCHMKNDHINELVEELSLKDNDLEESKDMITDLKDDIECMKRRLDVLKMNYIYMRDSRDKLYSENRSYQTALNEKDMLISDLREEIGTLESLNNGMSNFIDEDNLSERYYEWMDRPPYKGLKQFI